MVAPLTTALMTSVPERNAGVASAINNAISRVGSPLVNALIFVAVASSFYAAIATRVPSVDTGSSRFRTQVSPLNEPVADVSPRVREAARVASTEAFHLSMLVAAGLLAVGATINAVGIRNPSRSGPRTGHAAEQPAPASGAVSPREPIPAATDDPDPAPTARRKRGPAFDPP